MTEQREARALLGFMDEQEAIVFLKSRCILEDYTDNKLKEIWKSAKSAIASSSAYNLTPEISEIDSRFSSELMAISKEPLFAEAVLQKKWEFKLVEIDKLVCFQRYVDTSYSNDISKKYDFADLGKLIEFSLTNKPLKRPLAQILEPEQKVQTLLTPNIDLRVLGTTQMEDPVTKRKIFGFLVGWGLPYIQVVKLRDRYFLRNGYHRAYVVRKSGITHVPCILIQGETFGDTGAAMAGFFSQELLASNRPPVFADFFSDQISPKINMRPMTKIVRLHAEEYALPVTAHLPSPKEEEPAHTTSEETVAIASETEYEDFSIVKEDWNLYKLSDGTVLKLRQVLLRLKKEPIAGQMQSNVSFEPSSLMMVVIPPRTLKGLPSAQQFSPQELSTSVVEKNIGFKNIQDITNEYVMKGGLKILLQVYLANVGRTNKFSATGDPIYIVNTQTNIQVGQTTE